MKIEKLRLRGFIGIQRGLGLEQIEIDVSGKTGLTAFDGQNGAGKSTILENLHPFNQLASRDGALFNHVYDRKSEKELSFSYQGHSYRTLLKIDAQSEKTEGFVWKDGESQVNGKISAYAKYIRELFGSPELFFSSVFCAQNSKKLSDMRTGELKDLFAEFLRLDRLQGFEITAKQAGNIVEGKSAVLNGRTQNLQDVVKQKDEIEEKRLSLGDKLAGIVDNKTIIEHDLQDKKKEVEALREICAKNSVLLAQRDDLQRTIDRMSKDMAGEKATVEAELKTLKTKYQEIELAIKKCDAILSDRESIMLADDQAKQAQQTIDELMPVIDEISRKIEKKQAEVHALDKEIDSIKRDALSKTSWIVVPEKDSALIKMRHEADTLRSKMIDLDRKDPACQSTTCVFIKGALEAANRLPHLEKEISDRTAAIDFEASEIRAEISLLTQDMEAKTKIFQTMAAELKTGREVLAAKMNVVRPLRESLPKLREKAAKSSEIAVAESRKADLCRQSDELQGQIGDKDVAWAVRQKALIEAIAIERDKLDAIEIDADAPIKLKSLAEKIQFMEKTKLPELDTDIETYREGIAKLKADLDRIAEAEKELEQVKADREALSKEVSEWRYIQTACGKNGLQALEIDGAAPLITHYANQLLSQAFGPLYSVRFRTQDDEGRECLDIIVIGEDGQEILLDNLSGGQRVWVLMALRLAMTLLSKEKGGHDIQTAFADEMDGALDPENALNFVSMYRSFMKVGGFEDFLFISHRPECRNMADHVLSFEHGKNPAWR